MPFLPSFLGGSFFSLISILALIAKCSIFQQLNGKADYFIDTPTELEYDASRPKDFDWGYSSAGRALAWHARGQRFDPA